MDYAFPKNFLIGAATAAHQVEGGNIHSDYWVMEQLKDSTFAEPSLDAVDHYHRYEEDIRLMEEAGLNAFRFTIEWARIEPKEGYFDAAQTEHYRKVLLCCKARHITPVVTLHHGSSPKWLIERGGWEWEGLPEVFARYSAYIAEELGDLLRYVCTINEANMGLQIASVAAGIMNQMGVAPQIGMDFSSMIEKILPKERLEYRKNMAARFGFQRAEDVHDFLSLRTCQGDLLTVKAHEAARKAMKALCPGLKIGMTLSLFDIQAQEGGENLAAEKWQEHFGHYKDTLMDDDFIGIQNYTRERYGASGVLGNEPGAELTQMGYEYCPEALENVVRRVAGELPGKELLVTENGIATSDDARRIAFLHTALKGLENCVRDGLPVTGYLHWSLLDNFEWQKGYAITFGLIGVDRKTQKRYPKESLYELGSVQRYSKRQERA